jgi:hypothetical protein
MSFLSSSRGKRQLVLICVRLLVQCVMASSIQQAGIDEADLKAVPTSKTPISAMSAHHPRLGCMANKDFQHVGVLSHTGLGPGGANTCLVARG